MSQPYVGQILMFGGNFAPVGWMNCAGQLLPISENEVLFQLIGTTYGGDGQNTFALPDLRGRAPIHQGQGGGLSNYIIGESFGVEAVTLTTQQLPVHNHTVSTVSGNTANNVSVPANNVVLSDELTSQAAPVSAFTYVNSTASSVPLGPKTIGPAGGSQPHENHQPLLVINYIIALEGVFPSQN